MGQQGGKEMKITVLIIRFVIAALKALTHPQNDVEWRQAWMWFVWPVFFIGGFGVLVAWATWSLHFPWWVVAFWLFYIWVCEPVAYITTPEGEALQKKQARWIEYGE